MTVKTACLKSFKGLSSATGSATFKPPPDQASPTSAHISVLVGRPEMAIIGLSANSIAYTKTSWNMYSMRFSAVLFCRIFLLDISSPVMFSSEQYAWLPDVGFALREYSGSKRLYA
ncbi:MAG: hypothetical protein WAO78_09650 [Roseovarius sp.]